MDLHNANEEIILTDLPEGCTTFFFTYIDVHEIKGQIKS